MTFSYNSPGMAPGTSFFDDPSVGPFHVVAGIHIGAMSKLPHGHNIHSVVTVADQPGLVPDGVSHKHLPLSYQSMNQDTLLEAVLWTLEQVHLEHTVLIRSERGLQRPALVAATVVLHMGGWYFDAMTCVKKANPKALTDFRYLNMLKETDKFFRGEAATR